MGERLLQGLPASPGEAAGRARVLDPAVADGPPLPEAERPAALAAARAALASAGEELDALAARLREDGRAPEAEIVETGVLMAADPALDAALEAAVLADGRPAAAALVAACGMHADAIAALPDELLAARADDVRSLGRRAARKLPSSGTSVPRRERRCHSAPRSSSRPTSGRPTWPSSTPTSRASRSRAALRPPMPPWSRAGSGCRWPSGWGRRCSRSPRARSSCSTAPPGRSRSRRPRPAAPPRARRRRAAPPSAPPPRPTPPCPP